jgi:hypothetical protein
LGFCLVWAKEVQAMLSFLLNVVWFVLGGLLMGLGWWLA